jgi:hypothetical protein
VAIRVSGGVCAQVRSQSTDEDMAIDHSISKAIGLLKNEFGRCYKSPRSLLTEILPVSYSKFLPISNDILESLHRYVAANPMYFRSHNAVVSGIKCIIYEGDINNYWLSSKKHDTCYQPFYPTWMLSAYALALEAKSLGFEQLVDVGAGDGRVAYCASLLRMGSYAIEIDDDLVQVQDAVSSVTGINFKAIRADATTFDYHTLDLSKPMFFISGLPEMGEMLANSLIPQVLSDERMRGSAGFNFMGSHLMKPLTRDKTSWGWGSVIARFGLELIGTLTLPTLWTTEQMVDTAYVYTRARYLKTP